MEHVRSDKLLTPIEPRPSLAVLVQGSSEPVFRGPDAEGGRYICGSVRREC
jgi:hypothetical protein